VRFVNQRDNTPAYVRLRQAGIILNDVGRCVCNGTSSLPYVRAGSINFNYVGFSLEIYTKGWSASRMVTSQDWLKCCAKELGSEHFDLKSAQSSDCQSPGDQNNIAHFSNKPA
jgi:hypothetical protein